jgi:predicted secreted Zn-dependent protease
MTPRQIGFVGLLAGLATALAINLAPAPKSLNAETAPSVPSVQAQSDSRLAVIRTESTYVVTGRTAGDLSRAFRTIGPLGNDGKRFAARTDWNIKWDYRYARRNRRIAIESFKVTLTVQMILPEWRPPADADRRMREEWTRYIENLSRHEEGHADIALESARKVIQTLDSFPAARTGAELRDSANAACHALIEECRQRNTAYDDATRHGRTQGAWLRE